MPSNEDPFSEAIQLKKAKKKIVRRLNNTDWFTYLIVFFS
jgi:hypothetical protein